MLRRYRQNLTQVRDLRSRIRQKMSALEEQDAALADQENSLVALVASEERRGDLGALLADEAPAAVTAQTTAAALPPVKRRPDTQVIEAIIRNAGRPLHVTEIVALARAQGLTFEGKAKPPARMIQDKLYGSSRFQLFSRNHWGLPGMTMPED